MPSVPEIIANSAKAPPIPDSPRLISSHDNPENCVNDLARSPRPWITINIDPEPIIPLKPAIFPRAPETVATSARAPPIPDSPLATPSQDTLANCLNADANLPSP